MALIQAVGMKKTRHGRRNEVGMLPPLACVGLALRSAPLPTQMEIMISCFLDRSHEWTLESASDAGFALLIQRKASTESPGISQDLRERRLKNAIKSATEAGNVLVLQSWMSSYRVPGYSVQSFVSSMFMDAVRCGHLNVLQWLQQQKLLPNEALPSIVMENGRNLPKQGSELLCKHPDVITWLYDHGCSRYVIVDLEKPARDCNFQFIQWIHNRQDQFKSVRHWQSVTYLAARVNCFDIVRWIYLNRPQDFTPDALKGAIEGAHLTLAQWISERGNFVIQDYSNLDAVDVSMVNWMLREYRCIEAMDRRNYCAHAMVCAAEYGCIDVMEFIHEHFMLGIGLNILPGNGASEESSILLWVGQDYASSHYHRLAERGNSSQERQPLCASQRHYHALAHTRVGKTAMKVAVKAGHLQVVQWLLEQGILGGNWVLNTAIKYGQLPIVQMLYGDTSIRECQRHVPVSTCIKSGNLKMLTWLHENRVVFLNCQDIICAAREGHLGILQYVCEYLNPSIESSETLSTVNKAFQESAANGHFAIVKWIHEKHPMVQCGFDCVSSLEIVKYLVLHCGASISADYIAKVDRRSDFALLEWLLERNQIMKKGLRAV